MAFAKREKSSQIDAHPSHTLCYDIHCGKQRFHERSNEKRETGIEDYQATFKRGTINAWHAIKTACYANNSTVPLTSVKCIKIFFNFFVQPVAYHSHPYIYRIRFLSISFEIPVPGGDLCDCMIYAYNVCMYILRNNSIYRYLKSITLCINILTYN